MTETKAIKTVELTPHISKLGVWSLAMGTSIGWGSLVVTSNSYLLQAGPLGSVVGMVIGAIVMIIISKNYHYMINCFPDAGGAYTYAKEVFGYDHGFLAAWFMFLTYASMLWANATSLPLFSRYFIGETFRFGYLYTVFGYDVYIGETLLSIIGVVIIAVICLRFRRIVKWILSGMVLLLSVGILICFVAAVIGLGSSGGNMNPAFIPDKSVLSQIVRIAAISPWAFIGFENVSHFSEEYNFERRKIFRIMTTAVVIVTVLYIGVILLSCTAYPPQFSSWQDYISNLGSLSGIEALPPFYAAQHYLGSFGVILLMATLLCLVISSLIGNILALSRLLYALGRDNILPEHFSHASRWHTPGHAILLITILSVLVPFLGRTAVGWIVDVTTLGATIIYGYVSACASRYARKCGDQTEMWTGRIGLGLMILVGAYLLLPELFGRGIIENESFFLFVVWSILGLVAFRVILGRDKEKKFGRSVIIWIALLALVLFVAIVWMRQSMMIATENVKVEMEEYYSSNDRPTNLVEADQQAVTEAMERLEETNSQTVMIVSGLFAFSLLIMFLNFSFINRRSLTNEKELLKMHDMVMIDSLTGVKSKNAYLETERAYNFLTRENLAHDFAVVVCDVNGLKHVNDTYGHKAGDEYICAAANLICTVFDHSPVFRTGGDEFVVLLEGRDYEMRKKLVTELFDRSRDNIPLEKVVVAGGMSEYDPANDKQFHDVFERADALMYERKMALKELGAKTRT